MIRMSILALLTTMACAPSRAGTVEAAPIKADQAVAVFAGGCFWCMEKPFEHYTGVITVESGYTGGPEIAPTYKDVGYGRTGHFEAVRVVYDPSKTNYEALLSSFWHNIDPTQSNGQFCDKGHQYATAIFSDDKAEKKLALKTRDEVAKELNAKVVTEILPAATFWLAEDYHQDYSAKNPQHYMRYRTGCGRDRRLTELWGEKAGQ